MQQPKRERRRVEPVVRLTARDLVQVKGGAIEGTWKLGNKIWQDDWIAPT